VPDQFEYSATYSEDGSIGLYLGTFRQAFAVVAFAATQKPRPRPKGFGFTCLGRS
jgi:hypothetical protein